MKMSYKELLRVRQPLNRHAIPAVHLSQSPLDDEAGFDAIAHSEGWLVPPDEVTPVVLRPWQQAVFWGLRVYIVVMLVIMVIGFAHVATGK